MFESNGLKFVVKIYYTNFNSFTILFINVKILFNFEKEQCTFDKEK